MASFANIYTHRKVADTASKPCEICYRPSTSVMVAPENKVCHPEMSMCISILISNQDFFYVCASHLKDKGFCNPIIDEAVVAARKKKEMDAEVERLKQEFEEKQKKKKEKESAKEKEKDKDKDKDKDSDEKTADKKADEKVRSSNPSIKTDD